MLAIFGIGLGVAALIVVLSVMQGFEDEVKGRLSKQYLHIEITPTPKAPSFLEGFVSDSVFPSFENLLDAGESKELVIVSDALLRVEKKMSGVVLKGISSERFSAMRGLTSEEISAKEPKELPGVAVGRELAFELGLIEGDIVTIVSPTEMEGPLGETPKSRRFRIFGVYRTGIPDMELQTVYMEKSQLASFLRRQKVSNMIEVSVNRFDQADVKAAKIRQSLTELGMSDFFRVRDWKELNAHLFYALKMERIGMFIGLCFIVLVASFNIISSLSMSVARRKKEIGILRTLGATKSDVTKIFLLKGIYAGVLGILGGLITALVICFALKRYQFVKLPDMFYDTTLPVAFDPATFVGVPFFAFLIIAVASLGPSRKAARIYPLDAIRS